MTNALKADQKYVTKIHEKSLQHVQSTAPSNEERAFLITLYLLNDGDPVSFEVPDHLKDLVNSMRQKLWISVEGNVIAMSPNAIEVVKDECERLNLQDEFYYSL